MKRFFLSLIAIAFIVFSGNSQKKWTLQECVQEAINNNLQIKANAINLRHSDINFKQAKHSRYPNLSGNISSGWNFGRTIDPTSNEFITQTFFNNGYQLSSNIVLFNAGRINNQIKQSKLDKEASSLDLDALKRDITLNVATGFLNVLFTLENRKLAQKQLENTQAQIDQLKKSIQAGSRPKNEIYNLEAQKATDEQNKIVAQNNYENAILSLKQQMRYEGSEELEIQVPKNIGVTTDPDEIELSNLYREALPNQPNIDAAKTRIRIAELDEKIAKSNLYPSLFLGGNLSTNYSNQGRELLELNSQRISQEVFINSTSVVFEQDVDVPVFGKQGYTDQLDQNLSYGFGLQLSVPIYQNYQNKAGVERAKLNQESSINNLEILKDQLLTNVQQALAAAKAAKYQYYASISTKEARKLAYDNLLKSYEIGAASNFELVTSKNQLSIAEINEINAKYDYIFRTKVLDFYLGNPINIK